MSDFERLQYQISIVKSRIITLEELVDRCLDTRKKKRLENLLETSKDFLLFLDGGEQNTKLKN